MLSREEESQGDAEGESGLKLLDSKQMLCYTKLQGFGIICIAVPSRSSECW